MQLKLVLEKQQSRFIQKIGQTKVALDEAHKTALQKLEEEFKVKQSLDKN